MEIHMDTVERIIIVMIEMINSKEEVIIIMVIEMVTVTKENVTSEIGSRTMEMRSEI